MNTGVYKITNLVNGKCYIGSASNWRGYKQRWGNHRRELCRNRHINPHLQHAWNKYGPIAFKFEILKFCLPHDCIRLEQQYLDHLDWSNTYNILHIAGSHLGAKRSEETKRKISEANKGQVPWSKGRKMPPKSLETRKKLSIAAKGRQTWLGRHHTEESKLKMSLAKLNIKS